MVQTKFVVFHPPQLVYLGYEFNVLDGRFGDAEPYGLTGNLLDSHKADAPIIPR